ncbi:MAG TPA: hypothetical protein VGR85_03995 [Candidatus Limnocylindria bacterium]|jgi:hypothetical protein|nr:hypothetical protein [Candidatus Limnocylindria bacterium]
MDPITLVVKDAFVIRGRGVLVYPAVDIDHAKPARLTVDLAYPDGTTRQVPGQLMIEFQILLNGGRRTDVLVVLDESVGAVPPGTTLTARIVDHDGPGNATE